MNFNRIEIVYNIENNNIKEHLDGTDQTVF